MPQEYRLIQFREKEIEEAVDRWLRSSGELGQYGRCGNLQMSETEKVISIVADCWDIQGRHRKNHRQVTIDHDAVGQMIVLFCKDHSIPLSRQGRKIFRLMDGQIAMYYQLN
jgi:hypothetical protein